MKTIKVLTEEDQRKKEKGESRKKDPYGQELQKKIVTACSDF